MNNFESQENQNAQQTTSSTQSTPSIVSYTISHKWSDIALLFAGFDCALINAEWLEKPVAAVLGSVENAGFLVPDFTGTIHDYQHHYFRALGSEILSTAWDVLDFAVTFRPLPVAIGS